mgnify:CR=1 FL=1
MITFLFYNCISRFLGSNPIQEKVLYLKTFPCTFVWLSWLVRHNWAVISQIGLSLLSVRSCLLWATLNTLNISHFYNSRLVTKYVTQQMVRIVKILYLLIYYTSMPLMYPLRVGFFIFFSWISSRTANAIPDSLLLFLEIYVKKKYLVEI